MAIELADFCLHAQAELNTVAGQNGNPLMNRQPVGMIDALVSAENTEGMEVDTMLDKGDGKLNTVSLKWLRPDAEADSTDEITDLCEEEGEQSAYVYTEPELTREVASSVTVIPESQLRGLCEPLSEFRTKVLAGKMNSILAKMDKQLIADYMMGYGKFIGGDAGPNSYQFLYDGGIVQADINGEIQMMRDYDNSGAIGRAIVVGDGNIDTYVRLMGYGCCNDLGQDLSKAGRFNYYYDRYMNGVLSDASEDNVFFAWAPRAAQLLTKPYNYGDFRQIGADFAFDTITDPITGLTFDMELYYDKCQPRGWKLRLSLRYGLWQLPQDLFKTTDTDRTGVNYNFLFAATQGS